MPRKPGDAFRFGDGDSDSERIKIGDPRALSFLAAVRRAKPDLIHCHDGTAARWTRFMPFRPKAMMTLHQTYKPATMDHFDGIHALADWQAPDLAGFRGKVARINNWMPTLALASTAEIAQARALAGATLVDFLLVYLGRLEEVKGVHNLISAFRALPDPKLKLAIVGGGADEAALREQAKGETRITFMGHSSRPAAWYGAADLMVMPSRREPFALVALEAMACGAPILASNVDGFAEIFRDRPDCLIAPQDVGALSVGIAERAAHKAQPLIVRDHYDMARFDRALGVAAVTRFSHEIVSG
jgi:glycosyltransferase involved in cell wall biosynthesis